MVLLVAAQREGLVRRRREEEDQDFNPVYDSVDFDAFTEFCLAREASLPRNALDHLERALRREPGFRMALVEYLSHCYQVDELCHSLALLNAYLNVCEDDQEILIAAANLCLAFNVVDEGLGYATSAFVRRPGDVEPRVLMARFLFAKEMPEDARAHLDAALRSTDPSPEAKYCLGRYFLDLGDIYRSRDYFEQCLEADPGYFVALRDLQCCYYELGDFAKGIDACERLLEADPADAGSYYNLGLIYQRQGRTRLAVKYFEEAVRQDGTFYKAVYMVGEHLYVQGEFEGALARFEEAHRLAPSSSEVLGRIGDCHWELGRSKDALRHYAWARQEDPVFDSARHRLIEGAEASERGARPLPQGHGAERGAGRGLERAGRHAAAAGPRRGGAQRGAPGRRAGARSPVRPGQPPDVPEPPPARRPAVRLGPHPGAGDAGAPAPPAVGGGGSPALRPPPLPAPPPDLDLVRLPRVTLDSARWRAAFRKPRRAHGAPT